MKLKKNVWLKIGVLTTPLCFLPTISCLSNTVYASTDISGIQKTFEKEIKLIQDYLAKDDQLRKTIANQKIIQISIAGKINDNSFAQMTWEGVSHFSRSVNNSQSSYKTTSSPSISEVTKAYSNALNKNYNIWILTGWVHESFFANWLKNPINKDKFRKNKVKVISIDWDVNKYLKDSDGTEWGQGLSINFKTQEASFLIGYSVAEFLAWKYPGEDNKNKRIINTTAGADASGSTNFNYGFLEGIRAWNNEQTNDENKILSNVYNDNSKVFLKTTYTENSLETKNDFRLSVTGGGEQIYKEAKPAVVMPVAGDWSRAAANIIKETGNTNNQWVVGVDSNMAISYGDTYRNYFITSSEKRIGVAVFKALSFLTGISNSLNDNNDNNDNKNLFPDPNRMNWKINPETNLISDSDNKVRNMSVIGGIASGFVGASPSTIQKEEEAIKFNQIIESTQKKFFGDNGELAQDLKDNKEKVTNFNEAKKALDENPSDENRNKYNEAVFNLKNVLLGEMNINNNLYFNLVVDDINKWNK